MHVNPIDFSQKMRNLDSSLKAEGLFLMELDPSVKAEISLTTKEIFLTVSQL